MVDQNEDRDILRKFAEDVQESTVPGWSSDDDQQKEEKEKEDED